MRLNLDILESFRGRNAAMPASPRSWAFIGAHSQMGMLGVCIHTFVLCNDDQNDEYAASVQKYLCRIDQILNNGIQSHVRVCLCVVWDFLSALQWILSCLCTVTSETNLTFIQHNLYRCELFFQSPSLSFCLLWMFCSNIHLF